MNSFLQRHNEKGQSLVEFVILIPLFFIILSGINLYLNQEIKSLTEDSTYDSLLISDSHFDSEERILANWNAAEFSTKKYNELILYNSFNSSSYFKNSVDMSHDVFLDKKNIHPSTLNKCDKNPAYQLDSSKEGEFKFKSCTNANGFENTNFSYGNIFEDFKITTRKYNGKSIYYPKAEFAWEKRHLLVSDALKSFQMYPTSYDFSSSYASLAFPKDKAQFNSKCLMNPETPDCSLPPLTGKWRGAAFDGANIQVVECLAEASAKCLKFVAPPAIAACVVERTAEINVALVTGQKASVCPILNRIVENMYNEVLMTAEFYEKKNRIQEAAQRGKIF